MNMAQGLGWNQNGGFLLVSSMHFRMSWLIGGVIGALMAAVLVSFVQKRILLVGRKLKNRNKVFDLHQIILCFRPAAAC